jgi:hypothetical protein
MCGIVNSFTGIEMAPEIIGLMLMHRCRTFTPKDHYDSVVNPNEAGIEHEDIAIEYGCTFKIRALINNIGEEEAPEARAKHMASWTQISISTIGRPRNPIRETEQTDIMFGVEIKGEHNMKREGDNNYLYPSELTSKIDE